MSYIGVDVSKWQHVLPWAAWRDRVSVVSIQVTHGTAPDPWALTHLSNALAAGYTCIGAYHYLMPGNGAAQCTAFIKACRHGHTWAMLDIEEPGITAGDVLAWADWYEAHAPAGQPLMFYGNNQLAAIVAANPQLARYGVWWAAYPTYPNLITDPPPGRPNTPAGLRVVAWQYGGDNGRLPPYTEAIDLTVWYEVPCGGAPMTTIPQPRGALYGAHGESGNQIIPLQRKFQGHGVSLAAVLAVENPGLCADAKALGVPITICRWKNPNDRWEGGQDVESWDARERQDFAAHSIQMIFDRANESEYAGSDFFVPGYNEWDPHTDGGYRAMGEVLCLLCDEATRRSPEMEARGRHAIRLALPGLNNGTPEYSAMRALFGTGLAQKMQARGDLLLVHEGVTFDEPIDTGYGVMPPGAPTVPGAGSLCLRVNILESVIEQITGTGLPWVTGEWYDGLRATDDPAARFERMRWYDRRARLSPWYRGACAYELTDNPGSQWDAVDFTKVFQLDALLADMLAEQGVANQIGDDMQPLYHAKALIDLALRAPDGSPANAPVASPPATQGLASVVKAGTLLHVYAENVTAGPFSNRAAVTPDGLSVWGVAAALEKV